MGEGGFGWASKGTILFFEFIAYRCWMIISTSHSQQLHIFTQAVLYESH